MKRFLLFAFAVTALAAIVAACQNMPAITQSVPTPDTKVYIPDFQNKSGEPGLASLLHQMVVQDFLIDGRLQVVDKAKADMILQGVVERYDRLVMTYDQNEVPEEYKLQMIVDLTMTDAKTGKRLWTTHPVVNLTPGAEVTPNSYDENNLVSLKEFTTYYVLNIAGVPPEDEPTAQNTLCQQMATHVVRRTIDGY